MIGRTHKIVVLDLFASRVQNPEARLRTSNFRRVRTSGDEEQKILH